MTYSPGSPGYPPAQSPGAYGGSAPSFVKDASGASKLPLYLNIAVAALGPASYLASFGPMFTIYADMGPGGGGLLVGGGIGTVFAVVAILLASLFGAIGLLPKAKDYAAVVAALAVLGALLVIAQTVNAPSDWSIGWALWLILGFSVIQAFVAVMVLLLEQGVITAPAPRPRYDPYAAAYGQYGQYGHYGTQAAYYGQPGGQQHASVRQHGPAQSAQPSGYGSQYPYASAPVAPSNSGFGPGGAQSGPQQDEDQSTSTPPTGFPSFASPSAAGTAGAGSQGTGVGNAPSPGGSHSGQQAQQAYGQGQAPAPATPSGPSGPSGPAPA